MEDSYTVHRRRKAAARKREKTPEPPRRNLEDVVGTDEEEDARARMERMVQETERLEELEEAARLRAEAEKSSDRAAQTMEKPQRALKRAMSPEVRRKDEEDRIDDENFEPKAIVEVLTIGIRPSADKISTDNKILRGGATKTSGLTPEVAGDQTKESFGADVEKARKPKKEEIDERITTSTARSSRTVERRPEVDKDFSPESMDKSIRSVKKAMSPDIEKVEKNRSDGSTVDEWSKDSGSSARVRAKKTPSRISDKENEEEAATLDKNRYEAAAAVAATRESDAGPTRSISSGRSDNVKHEDPRKKDADDDTKYSKSHSEITEKHSKLVDETPKIRRRDVTSPSKIRNSESRVTSSTSKRSTKDRNIEKTGYTTDSSETEETAKRVMRRKKSPEGVKARSLSSRKTPSRSRVTTDTDGDVEDHETSKRMEKRSTSRRRRSSETDEDRRDVAPRAPARQIEKSRSGEKRSSSRPKNSSDGEDDPRSVIRKSGTFPIDRPRDRSPSVARSSTDLKKQIIPLSDDSLIEDFEKAQLEYLRKERGILDYDPLDDYVDPKMEAALRRRKFSIIQTEVEAEIVAEQLVQPEKRSWFGWLPKFFGKKGKKKIEDDDEVTKAEVIEEKPPETFKEEKAKDPPPTANVDLPQQKRVSIFEFFRTLVDIVCEFRAFVAQNPRETRTIRVLRNRCLAELLLAIIYCGLGAFVFRFTEGAFETFYKCGVKRVKRDFLDTLWNFSHNMREEDWKSMARRKLMEFEEQLHNAHEAGVHSYSGQKSWSFLNAVVYCLTVITTIGYGHISPGTTTGRAITIVYAIFGIPMFLIILADFGKLFTRGIKFLWAFVRRLYYTGSCRRVRRTGPVQEVMKGVQLVYDFATFRRPSQMNPDELQEMQKQQSQAQTVLNLDGNAPQSAPPDTPGTPAMSSFAIDDEFNLPISVAIFILLVYIFVGATVYNFWEEWGFFESFYFVFISMSTIGFGDYVPKHPIYMMLSIIYLVFGLALTSMCINVVQVMLSDSFKQASQKIGATIGFEVAEDEETAEAGVSAPVELDDVHTTIKESESKEQMAPTAKQEDVEL